LNFTKIPDHYIRIHFKCENENCSCGNEEKYVSPLELSYGHPRCSNYVEMSHQFTDVMEHTDAVGVLEADLSGELIVISIPEEG